MQIAVNKYFKVILPTGSANINDRSLAGDRDSEVVLHIEDREMIPSTLNRMYFY